MKISFQAPWGISDPLGTIVAYVCKHCPSSAYYQTCPCLIISIIRILNVVLNIKINLNETHAMGMGFSRVTNFVPTPVPMEVTLANTRTGFKILDNQLSKSSIILDLRILAQP